MEALSLTRSRQFLLMVEGECANLVCRHRASGGVISRLEFPPLTESLRDLISATAARFGLRGRALPEGDQEKAMEVSCLGSSRTPTLGYRDMIPRVCPLEALSNQERRDIALCADKGTGAGPSGPAAAGGGGRISSSSVSSCGEAGAAGRAGGDVVMVEAGESVSHPGSYMLLCVCSCVCVCMVDRSIDRSIDCNTYVHARVHTQTLILAYMHSRGGRQGDGAHEKKPPGDGGVPSAGGAGGEGGCTARGWRRGGQGERGTSRCQRAWA